MCASTDPGWGSSTRGGTVLASEHRSIQRRFEARAARAPEAVAVRFQSDDGEQHQAEQLTYGALNRRSNQLAHYLKRLGSRPGERVGLCLERSIDLVVGILGTLKAGGTYLPLDPTTPADRLALLTLRLLRALRTIGKIRPVGQRRSVVSPRSGSPLVGRCRREVGFPSDI